jgi:hypothetical protein
MSVMLELWYAPPANPRREERVARQIENLGGRLTFREEPRPDELSGICLTFEFADRAQAEDVASSLRKEGEHIEGPMDYGDN